MVTFTTANPLVTLFAVTLTAILSPLTTVVLEPLTSAPFFTSVQAAPVVVRARVTGASNRQEENPAVTAVPSPATVTALLVTTAPGAASNCGVNL